MTVSTSVAAKQPSELSIESQLESSGNLMIAEAQRMTIESQSDYEYAGRFLVEIKTRTKQVKDYWAKPKSDAKSAHQTICDREKEMLRPLADAEAIIKKSMVNYQAAVEKARREAEEAARKRQQEEADRLLEQAIAAEECGNDRDAAVNMAMAQMVSDMNATPVIAAPKATGTSVRKTWKARIVDPTLVPAYANGLEIREIKMTALNSIAKMTNGTASIPGVEFYEDIGIAANSR